MTIMQNYRLSIFFALLCCTQAMAQRSETQMSSIARSVLSTHLHGNRAAAPAQVHKVKDYGVMSVYQADVTGFVFVGRDEQSLPVLGYSATQFDADNMPCCMKWWIETCCKLLEKNPESVLALDVPAAAPGGNTDQGDYLVQAKWNQEEPYNEFTPLIDGKHAPTGCVATAMGQIMKFYEYPAQGRGTGSYTIGNNSKKYSYDIEGHVYEWSAMKNKYGAFGAASEVALLLADAGASCQMNYNLAGSGSNLQYAAQGMTYNFTYDDVTMRCLDAEFYTNNEFSGMVYNEFKENRPVLFSGVDNGGGHAFVIDGVDSEGLVHVNWGWGGAGNGYFALATMNGYSEGQSALIGINRKTEGLKMKEYSCIFSPTGFQFKVKNNHLMLELYDMYNYDYRPFSGMVYIGIESISTGELYSVPLDEEVINLDTFYGGDFTDDDGNPESLDITDELETKLPQGEYWVFMYSQSDKEKKAGTYSKARAVGGIVQSKLTVQSNGKLKIQSIDPDVVKVRRVMAATTHDDAIYNLSGQRVDASYRGLTIVNGRKMAR